MRPLRQTLDCDNGHSFPFVPEMVDAPCPTCSRPPADERPEDALAIWDEARRRFVEEQVFHAQAEQAVLVMEQATGEPLTDTERAVAHRAASVLLVLQAGATRPDKVSAAEHHVAMRFAELAASRAQTAYNLHEASLAVAKRFESERNDLRTLVERVVDSGCTNYGDCRFKDDPAKRCLACHARAVLADLQPSGRSTDAEA